MVERDPRICKNAVVLAGSSTALAYAESRQNTKSFFVFVIMVVAGSRPILEFISATVDAIARLLPWPPAVTQTWLCLAFVPLVGSLITEPAAMTLPPTAVAAAVLLLL